MSKEIDKEVFESIVLKDLNKYVIHSLKYKKLNKIINIMEFISNKSYLTFGFVFCLFMLPNLLSLSDKSPLSLSYMAAEDLFVLFIYGYFITSLTVILSRMIVLFVSSIFYKEDFSEGILIPLSAINEVIDKINKKNEAKDISLELKNKHNFMLNNVIEKRNIINSTLDSGVTKDIINVLLKIELELMILVKLKEKK